MLGIEWNHQMFLLRYRFVKIEANTVKKNNRGKDWGQGADRRTEYMKLGDGYEGLYFGTCVGVRSRSLLQEKMVYTQGLPKYLIITQLKAVKIDMYILQNITQLLTIGLKQNKTKQIYIY